MSFFEEPKNSRAFTASRSDYLLALAVAIITFGLHYWQTSDMESLAGQFSKYPVAANQLLAGILPAERLFDYSQVYLHLCALIAKFSSRPFLVLYLTQLVLVSLCAGGLFLLLRRYFGRPWSGAGTAVFMLNPSLMIYGYIFEPEPILLLFLIAAVYLSAVRSGTSNLFAGVAVLLSLLTRPVFLLLAIAVPVYNWLHLEGRQRLAATACFSLPIVSGLILFAVYVTGKGSSFPPPLMNPGVVFFEGNNPLSNGGGAAYLTLVNDMAEDFPGESDYQHAVYRLVARQDVEANLAPAEVNRFWAAKGLAFLVDEPAHAVALLMNKAFFACHSFRWHDIRAATMVDKFLHEKFSLLVPLGPIAALAVFGMIYGLRQWREFLLFYTICGSQLALMLVTYASDRQRLAMLPFLIVFAVLGAKALLGKPRQLFVAGAVLIVLIGVLSRDADVMRDNREMWRNYDRFMPLIREAQSQRDVGQLSLAIRTTARALATAPWAFEAGGKISGLPITPRDLAILALVEFDLVREDSPTAQFDRALLLIAAGRMEDADRLLADLEQRGGRFERSINRLGVPSYYRGLIAAQRGDTAPAVTLLQQALTSTPGDPDVLAQLAVLTGDQEYVTLLGRYFDRFDGYYYLGRAFLENGKAAGAAEMLQPLQQRLPDYWKGKMYLAAALADCSRDSEATAIFLAAMRQRSEPAMFQEKILPAFQRQAEAASPEKSAHFWYGKVLRHFGLYSEARNELRASLAATGRPEVAEELHSLEGVMQTAELR